MILLKFLVYSIGFTSVMGAGYDYEDLEYETNYEDYLAEDEQIPKVRKFPSRPGSKAPNAQDMLEVREAVKRLLSNIDERALTDQPTHRTKRSDIDALYDPEDADNNQPLTRIYDYVTQPTRSQLRKFLFNNIQRNLTQEETENIEEENPTAEENTTAEEIISAEEMTTEMKKSTESRNIERQKKQQKGKDKGKKPTTTTTTETTTTAVTTTTTKYVLPTARWPIDVPALLDLIALLAADYETNLTRKLNESLVKMSIPTCETFTPYKVTTSEYDANATGTVVAKCFVCGLEEEGVPFSAPCADAFAGDFLPLVPVDPTARAQISKFRKYCKYLNIRGYQYNESEPRAIFGRWTGGCGVRWVDLTGIYTQRTCRSRFHATMGRHFASKRMAKLEMSLLSVDNGCIISPMATLLPLSRGISLFARFHACVCTGSWCNSAERNAPWITNIAVLLYVILLQRTKFLIS